LTIHLVLFFINIYHSHYALNGLRSQWESYDKVSCIDIFEPCKLIETKKLLEFSIQ